VLVDISSLYRHLSQTGPRVRIKMLTFGLQSGRSRGEVEAIHSKSDQHNANRAAMRGPMRVANLGKLDGQAATACHPSEHVDQDGAPGDLE
jgi:hypothetical protein